MWFGPMLLDGGCITDAGWDCVVGAGSAMWDGAGALELQGTMWFGPPVLSGAESQEPGVPCGMVSVRWSLGVTCGLGPIVVVVEDLP